MKLIFHGLFKLISSLESKYRAFISLRRILPAVKTAIKRKVFEGEMTMLLAAETRQAQQFCMYPGKTSPAIINTNT